MARRQSRACVAGSLGSTRRWKASWAGKATVVDAAVGEAVLACRRKRSASPDVSTGQVTGDVRDRFANFARGRERRGEGAPHCEARALFREGHDDGFDRSWRLDVRRAFTWGRVARNGGLASLRRPSGSGRRDPTSRRLRPDRRGAEREPRAPRGDEEIGGASRMRKQSLEESRSGNRTAPRGAQSSSRLQKSVRGILPAGARGAERRTKRALDSSGEATQSRTGTVEAPTRKGVEGLRGENGTRNRRSLLARLEWSRVDPMEGALASRATSLLIRAVPKADLVRRKRHVP